MIDYSLENLKTCKNFFKIGEKIDLMIRLVYSDNRGRLDKNLADKIGDLLLECKNHREICDKLNICDGTFYGYINPEYRKKKRESVERRWKENPDYVEMQRKNRKQKRESERKELAEEIIDLLKRKEGSEEICNKLNISTYTFLSILGDYRENIREDIEKKQNRNLNYI